MKEFFKELLEYGHFYNQKLIEIFDANPDKVSEKAVKLFSHILNSHHIWNSRIKSIPSSYSVWQIQKVQDFKAIEKTNYESSMQILNAYDLNTIIEFKLSNGQAFKNSVRDILFQVINHSTYHRAQLATEFRNSGIDPLLTDYIVYKWK